LKGKEYPERSVKYDSNHKRSVGRKRFREVVRGAFERKGHMPTKKKPTEGRKKKKKSLQKRGTFIYKPPAAKGQGKPKEGNRQSRRIGKKGSKGRKGTRNAPRIPETMTKFPWIPH